MIFGNLNEVYTKDVLPFFLNFSTNCKDFNIIYAITSKLNVLQYPNNCTDFIDTHVAMKTPIRKAFSL